MKQWMIFGAGQAGRALYKLLHSGKSPVIAFADSNPSLWGKTWDGVPILPLEEAVRRRPSGIFLGIINRESCREVGGQLRRAGYDGPLYQVSQLQNRFHIRLATLRLMAEELESRAVPGALAELGVYQGEFAGEINRLLPDRKLYLFDTFEGFHQRDVEKERAENHSQAQQGDFSDTSVETVLGRMPHPEQVVLRKGRFPETARGLEERFALVSLDADLYLPMYEGLSYFYPRLNPGGYLLLHDYNSAQYQGAGQAARRYCEENGIYLTPLCDIHGAAVLVKDGKR
ncbi:MAG: macrocin O-methyltransferase [Oscillospiraceae bacterium]|nr:macrocin O-methyltransferase [Oscillospiraceae bacterium]